MTGDRHGTLSDAAVLALIGGLLGTARSALAVGWRGRRPVRIGLAAGRFGPAPRGADPAPGASCPTRPQRMARRGPRETARRRRVLRRARRCWPWAGSVWCCSPGAPALCRARRRERGGLGRRRAARDCGVGSATRAAGRLVLGRRRGRLLYAEDRHALVAFGPPQSGKSAGLAIPALLEWNGPAVASSIKTDLLSATSGSARGARRGARVRPVRPRPDPGAHLVAAARRRHLGWRARGRVAARLRRRARPARRRGRRLLGRRRRAAPRAAALYRGGRSAPGWTAWCAGPTARGRGSSTRRSARLTGAAPDEAALAGRARGLRRGSGVRGAGRPHAHLDRGDRPDAAARLPVPPRAPVGDLRARSRRTALSTRRPTLYLIGDAKASKLLRPIFLALLQEIVDRAYERATLAGGALDAAAAAVPRRGGERRPAAQPRPRSPPPHRATTSSWSRSSMTSPRRGQPLRPAGRDRGQQPSRPDAPAGRGRPRHPALLLRPDRRGGGA